MVRSLALSLLVLCLFAPALHAASYVVPDDRELIRAAGPIVTGVVTAKHVRLAANGLPETVLEVRVDESIRGNLSGTIRVVQWGGSVNGRSMVQSGAPVYAAGERVLLFLTPRGRGEWTTYALALGAFRYTRDAAGAALVERAGEVTGWKSDGTPYVDRARAAGPFLDYVRAVARGENAAPLYAMPPRANVAPPVQSQATFTANSYVFPLGPSGARRRDSALDVGWQLYGTQSNLDMAGATDFGTAEWRSLSPNIGYFRSATPASGDTVDPDAESRIIANDPHGEVTGSCCPGVVATAFEFCDGPTCDEFTFNGETFVAITHSDVVVNDGATSGNLPPHVFDLAMTHELGHTLGLRHSNQNGTGGPCAPPLECCEAPGCLAVMNSQIQGALGGVGDWDAHAIDCVYDGVCSTDSSCTPPSITGQPQNRTVAAGGSTTISVTATGTGPLTYEWFIGTPGDTSQPAGTGSSINVTPAQTTSYWARVTGQCGSPANSNAATVTVQGCIPASITNMPTTQVIYQGQTAQLGVNATGTALTYQWYVGTSGDTSQPISASNSSVLLVTPQQTTSYWVRVTAQCGPPADSTSVTVVVEICPEVEIAAPTYVQNSNGTYTLTANATSSGQSLSYAWFRGTTPGSGTPVGNSRNITVSVSTATSYSVRVTNGCGNVAVSPLVTITPGCTLPSITTQPQDQTVAAGANATLTIAATGSTTITWFRGALTDRSAPAGTGASITVGPIAQTTTYWAEVANSCGAVQSRLVTLTVQCTAPAITAVTQSQVVGYGQSVPLSVTATGTAPLQIRWFQGALNDTSKPVGTAASITVGPVTRTTSYWVEVKNGCGTVTRQLTLTIQSKRRSVRH